jgi:uncharacterized integral membrane protein
MKLLFLFVLGWLLAALAIQNPGTIQLKFLAWKTAEISLIGVVLVSVLIGFLGGLIFSPLRGHRKKPPEQTQD